MKTIEITTETMPWVNDAPQALGSIVETDEATAEVIVSKRRAAAPAETGSADV